MYSHPSQMGFAQEGFPSPMMIGAVAEMQARGRNIRKVFVVVMVTSWARLVKLRVEPDI